MALNPDLETLTAVAISLSHDAFLPVLEQVSRRDSKLRNMNLQMNQLDDASAQAIPSQLYLNRALVSLDLRKNMISKPWSDRLADALSCRPDFVLDGTVVGANNARFDCTSAAEALASEALNGGGSESSNDWWPYVATAAVLIVPMLLFGFCHGVYRYWPDSASSAFGEDEVAAVYHADPGSSPRSKVGAEFGAGLGGGSGSAIPFVEPDLMASPVHTIAVKSNAIPLVRGGEDIPV